MKFLREIRDTTPRELARDSIRRLIACGRLRRGDRLPSYSELSERLGVSVLTVQRAMGDLAREGLVYRLHGKGCYVGRALNGQPRPFSQVGLVFGASLSLLVKELYLTRILGGVLDACTGRNLDLTILSLRTAAGRVPARQLVSQVDAVLLLGVTNGEYVREFLVTGVPAVQVDNLVGDCPMDAVVVDNRQAVRLVVRHLLDLGHRRIAYVTGLTSDPLTETWVESFDARERREAYLAEMAAAGLERQAQVFDGAWGGRRWDEVLAAMRCPLPPTAWITFSAPGALALCQELRRAGFAVPSRISVAAAAGADQEPTADGYRLTYAQTDFRAMGITAIETLARRCVATSAWRPTITRIGVQLTVGETTAPPSAA